MPDLAAIARRYCRDVSPTLILNAAAYTTVDRAETEMAMAMLINGEVPAALADEANRHGALLVHYSTDYVFDGLADRPYGEDDPDQTEYGRSNKAASRRLPVWPGGI